MRALFSILMLGIAILVSSCQPNQPLTDTPLESPSSIPETVTPAKGNDPMITNTPSPLEPGLQTLIDKIKEDLAGRLAIAIDAIEVAEVTEVEWSDSSLECPQPDMSYLQVITPGYRIVLRANEQVYEYHSNRDTYFVFCENRQPPVIPQP